MFSPRRRWTTHRGVDVAHGQVEPEAVGDSLADHQEGARCQHHDRRVSLDEVGERGAAAIITLIMAMTAMYLTTKWSVMPMAVMISQPSIYEVEQQDLEARTAGRNVDREAHDLIFAVPRRPEAAASELYFTRTSW